MTVDAGRHWTVAVAAVGRGPAIGRAVAADRFAAVAGRLVAVVAVAPRKRLRLHEILLRVLKIRERARRELD